MNLKPEINTKLYGYSDFFSSLNSIYEKKTLPNKIPIDTYGIHFNIGNISNG